MNEEWGLIGISLIKFASDGGVMLNYFHQVRVVNKYEGQEEAAGDSKVRIAYCLTDLGLTWSDKDSDSGCIQERKAYRLWNGRD